ncbi:hypothetical protein GGR51DRAFT_541692 [Nemania sp. FL0031]|nr:hypothetical protein GGR51DRAFT_541692 [Nemania sp. FL0031]
MSDSQHNGEGPVLLATDLLTYTTSQFVEFLERDTHRRNSKGQLELRGLDGVERLSRDQRMELKDKVCAAREEIEKKRHSRAVPPDELMQRLTNLADADDRDGSPSWRPRLSPASSQTSTILAPGAYDETDEEDRWRADVTHVRRELLADGSRPICSVEHLFSLMHTPTSNLKHLSPWFTNYHDSPSVRETQLGNVLHEQYDRWWEFRKSQWYNRRQGNSEAAPRAYIEAQRRGVWEIVGGNLRSERFYGRVDKDSRQQWDWMPIQLQLPGQPFPAYIAAVERRLRPYRFTHPIELKKDPRQQTKWTDWLEYLSYELWCYEELVAAVQPLEKKFNKSLTKLYEVAIEQGVDYRAGLGDLSLAQALLSMGTDVNALPRCDTPHPTDVDPKKLDEIRGKAFTTTNKVICEAVRHTQAYTYKQKTALLRKPRIDWIVEEAHVMEAEMTQAEAQQDGKSHRNPNRKRKSNDEDEDIPPRKQSKRSRLSGGPEISSSISSSKPQPRRSVRLAHKNNN